MIENYFGSINDCEGVLSWMQKIHPDVIYGVNILGNYHDDCDCFRVIEVYVKQMTENLDSKDSLYLIDALRHMTYGRKEPTLMNSMFKSLAVVQPTHCDYGMEINIE